MAGGSGDVDQLAGIEDGWWWDQGGWLEALNFSDWQSSQNTIGTFTSQAQVPSQWFTVRDGQQFFDHASDWVDAFAGHALGPLADDFFEFVDELPGSAQFTVSFADYRSDDADNDAFAGLALAPLSDDAAIDPGPVGLPDPGAGKRREDWPNEYAPVRQRTQQEQVDAVVRLMRPEPPKRAPEAQTYDEDEEEIILWLIAA